MSSSSTDYNLSTSPELLLNRIKELENELLLNNSTNNLKRNKIDIMSSEVIDSNPYSRLMVC